MNIETSTWTTVLLSDGSTQSGAIPHTSPISDNEYNSGEWRELALKSAQSNVNRMFSDGLVLSAITANAVLWRDDGSFSALEL